MGTNESKVLTNASARKHRKHHRHQKHQMDKEAILKHSSPDIASEAGPASSIIKITKLQNHDRSHQNARFRALTSHAAVSGSALASLTGTARWNTAKEQALRDLYELEASARRFQLAAQMLNTLFPVDRRSA